MDKLKIIENIINKKTYIYQEYFSNWFLIIFFLIIFVLTAIFFINVILFDPNQYTNDIINNLRDYNLLKFE